ncbi:hypothetical protein CASFOL_027412 [Castilleja foliolosa]|uniref:HhH-GPD domain-containing protein n=1 Tax=Castilleja foliolosa TaxID=1961234 RepID=A0ABD3CGA2_9LAMI
MAARGEGAPPELEDVQIGCSWIPATPVKPVTTAQQPICENRQINDPSQNWVESGLHIPFNPVTQTYSCERRKSQSPGDYNSTTTQHLICEKWLINNLSQSNRVEPAPLNPVTQAPGDYVQTAPACYYSPANLNNVSGRVDSNNWLLEENLSSFDTWQTSQPVNSHVYGDVLRTPINEDKLNNMSFQNLFALADAGGSKSVLENELTDTSNFRPFTMSYGNSRPHFDAEDIASVLSGVISSAPTRPSFDLNSLPRTTTTTAQAAFSKNMPFQLEPVTPQKPSEGESPKGTIVEDGVMELCQRKEKTHLMVDQASTATSSQLQESHKPDKGGTEDTILSKTPQLKARRKKHRPKVVIEGQKKRGPKPSVQKTPTQDTTRVKRKYVRKKGVTDSEINKELTSPATPTVHKTYSRRKKVNKPKDDMDKVTVETNDVNTPPQRTRRSCRRSLNFDSGGQMGDVGSSQEEVFTQGVEEKTADGTVRTRGKCHIVFSDMTHDKETPKSPGGSEWGSAWSTPERQLRGLKRQNATSDSEICNKNDAGTYYNFMQSYLPVFSQNAGKSNSNRGFHFPAIFKKKRTEKGHNMVASTSDSQAKLNMHALRNSWTNQISTVANQVQYQVANLLTNNPGVDSIQNGRSIFEDMLSLGPTERIRKKRTKIPTRVRDLASLLEICRQMPGSTSNAAATFSVKQNISFMHEPPTCMETLVADTRTAISTKKRSKRNMITNSTVQNLYNHKRAANMPMGPPPLALTWRNMSPVDSIVEQLNRLNINASNQATSEKQKALLASYRTHYLEQHALVPYQRSGAVVSFDRSFDQVRKRRERPKVDLDDETSKVWKLLLENINSEGIDGTDEEKTKWWEEERRVFSGRANSFIARMHLVQGDRRFSPWKGSVVDSVVGVFLTQNVSDHLSSSAFMSVAARFPLKPKNEPAELHEENLATEDVCCLDPDETFRLKDNILSQSVCGGGDTKMGQDFEGDSICDGLKLEDKSGGQSPDTSEHGLVTSVTNNSVSLIDETFRLKDNILTQSVCGGGDTKTGQDFELDSICDGLNLKEKSDGQLPDTSEHGLVTSVTDNSVSLIDETFRLKDNILSQSVCGGGDTKTGQDFQGDSIFDGLKLEDKSGGKSPDTSEHGLVTSVTNNSVSLIDKTFRLKDNILTQSICGGGDTKTGQDFEGDSICDGLNLKEKSDGQLPDTSEHGLVTSVTDNSVSLIDETFRLKDNILSQSVCGGGDTKTGQGFEGDSICDGLKFKEKSGGQSPDTSEHGLVMSVTNNSVSLIEDGKDAEDALSSQVSSQNSSNSPVAQTTDYCLPSTTSEEEPRDNTFNSSTSFVKLLQMAGTVLHGVYEVNGKTNSSDNMALDLQSELHLDNPTLHSETIAASVLSSESASGRLFQKITDINSVEEPKFSSTNATTSSNNDQGQISQKGQVPAQTLFDVTGSSSYVEVNSSKNNPKNHRSKTPDGGRANAGRLKKEKENQVDWDQLRKNTLIGGTERAKTANNMDSVDWDAVRCADVNEIAQTIKERGMNNMLAERIKEFLNRLVRDHGSIDLEWLRDVPPDKAKEYLLSVRGLGLKSVECVRLLTLHHLAFPVDTNVGRIAVRLGWVPLQPLPESLQLHLLELYPVMESIQKYLWPRLCKLDQPTLYELHYQMITFGKVFCTKSKPNCNACPMRGECRHFASAFASSRLSLPAPEEKTIVSATGNIAENGEAANQHPTRSMSNTLQLPPPEANQLSAKSEVSHSQPIIEEPLSPEPIVEMPSTPEQVCSEVSQCDIENAFNEDPDEIPTIQLNMEEFTHNLQKIMQQSSELQEGSNMSKALVALTSEAASIPVPKLKNINRLRTEHQVYELPDSHPLLEGMDKREPDDPCPYLLAIWTPGETVDSIEPPERQCSSGLDKLCTDETCLSCNSLREANSQTVRGTILIPCRTAMRGSFPLNGTYFQVNEVFSDHESSQCPLDVPRQWLWNLPRRTVYFGTSIPTIFKGLTTEGIQYCFWREGLYVSEALTEEQEDHAPSSPGCTFQQAGSPKGKEKWTRTRQECIELNQW